MDPAHQRLRADYLSRTHITFRLKIYRKFLFFKRRLHTAENILLFEQHGTDIAVIHGNVAHIVVLDRVKGHNGPVAELLHRRYCVGVADADGRHYGHLYRTTSEYTENITLQYIFRLMRYEEGEYVARDARDNTASIAKFAFKPTRDMAKQRVTALCTVDVVDKFEPLYIDADDVKQTVVRHG